MELRASGICVVEIRDLCRSTSAVAEVDDRKCLDSPERILRLPFCLPRGRRGSRESSRTLERGWGEGALASSRISGCFTGRFTRPADAVRVLCNAGSGPPLPDTADYSRYTSGNYGQFFPLSNIPSPALPPAVLHITGVRPRNYARSGRVNVKICMKLLCAPAHIRPPSLPPPPSPQYCTLPSRPPAIPSLCPNP